MTTSNLSRAALLLNCLRSQFPEWKVVNISLLAAGIEATAFRAETKAIGPLAIKVPLSRNIDNDNDQGLDARDLLRQDAMLFEHLRRYNLPAPEPIALHIGEPIDFLAYRYVVEEGAQCSAETVGRLVRRLHQIPLPAFVPVAHRRRDCVEQILAELTLNRLRKVQLLSRRSLPQITSEAFRSALECPRRNRSLLHMDVRASNLLCMGGNVTALIDWSNALLADPIIELARIDEYGWPMHEVWKGYGRDVFKEAPALVVLAARLYTAAMLAVVFLSEAPDPARADAAVERVRKLLGEFAAASQ